ncbi:hypothetical protein ACET3Z_001336 [Daucus carota]
MSKTELFGSLIRLQLVPEKPSFLIQVLTTRKSGSECGAHKQLKFRRDDRQVLAVAHVQWTPLRKSILGGLA